MDFVLEKGDERHLHRVGLVDRETGGLFSDKLNFIYVEVPKFEKKEADLETKFDKWLYVLKHLEYLERVPVRIREKIFEKVMDIATLVNLEKKDRKAYEQSLKQYRDLKNALDASKLEGKLEGEKLGLERGEKLGLEKGKRSGVINFFNEKVPVPVIAKAMELDESKVEGILREEGLL
ncbi:Rpn family recombination-promoting nuclease/putative transposase [Pleomorphovibrio marinus]|uniref:Rpn family recombination-promoting nuclease/putative transposase n=1 Tax=Pleomorphovibrio marinus TaxID=2164132 RepID=UPI0021CDECBC|nr:Rpn family recombination-promoting nuclease/putative transposase [Pleomorphovibrio marinus]